MHIAFGPDTYMGENLDTLFEQMGAMDDAAITAVHPAHDQESIRSLRTRFVYFEHGNCVVHHLFGADVVERVRTAYPDACVAAHLEVPGEMFLLGLEREKNDRGCGGQHVEYPGVHPSQRSRDAIDGKDEATLQFILGTEAGMITPIVRQVQALLREADATFAVDIVFPVASDAIAVTGESTLPIVPGVSGGEGCSTAGGCATCPYMKMNSLDALIGLCAQIGGAGSLEAFEPRKYQETIAGRTAADLGGEPILHMRAFQRSGSLPDALVDDIRSRNVD